MKTHKRIPTTEEGFKKLIEELENLKKERPTAVKNLSDARNLGDLSENGLYTAAKARLRSIDSQIFRIDMQIKLADVRKIDKDSVGIGSSVVVQDGSHEITYQIVGDYEANPREGKISQHSPLGKVLMGKKVNDEAIFESPGGSKKLKILKIS